MIKDEIKAQLKRNWGDLAHCLECYAEICFHDPNGSWKFYILAMDENEEYLECISYNKFDGAETCILKMNELLSMYNSLGEPLEIDNEYRRIYAKNLWRMLKI